jgi:hypothetical protein
MGGMFAIGSTELILVVTMGYFAIHWRISSFASWN